MDECKPLMGGDELAEGEAECRICGDACPMTELVVPCACKGGSMYAHHTCVQTWINTDKVGLGCERVCSPRHRMPFNSRKTPGASGLRVASEVVGAQRRLVGSWGHADGMLMQSVGGWGHVDGLICSLELMG